MSAALTNGRGPRWLVNRVAKLDPLQQQDLAMAVLGSDLYRDDACHVCTVYRSTMGVEGHDPEVYPAMQDLFDWHNLRITDLPSEPLFRCLAIYGAAAQSVMEGRK